MIIRNFLLLLLFSTALMGCLSPSDKTPLYTDVSVDQAKEMIDRGGYFILDVRTAEEYEAGHIAGSVLIPYDELAERLDEVPQDIPVLVYCRTARRSAIASNTLVDNGYTGVYNMAGGIVEWEKAGFPVEK